MNIFLFLKGIHVVATVFGFLGYGLSDKDLYTHWAVGENMLIAGFRYFLYILKN